MPINIVNNPMPFGKYKGKDLDDVPANYLDWLWGQDWISQWPTVENYIKTHKASIDRDLEEERDLEGEDE